uniref:MATH domain-containing protein n=1 Tax=Caenorhabditis tropicalis TaxID=1561998 RepID=A0A1I7TSS7_9PELO
MNQNELYDVQLAMERSESNDLIYKLAQLQLDTDRINKQLIENSLADENNNETIAEKLRSIDCKQEDISIVQESNQKTLKNVSKELNEIQKKQSETDEKQSTFEADVTGRVQKLTDELKTLKEEQKCQNERIDSMKEKQVINGIWISNLREETSRLNKKENNNNDEIGKDMNIKEIVTIRDQIADMKIKQEVQDLFNAEVIKEFHATQREIAALNKKNSEEQNKNIIPIEKAIVGMWKPSSLNDYKHYVKPEEPTKRSHWLSGRLMYSLKSNQFTYKLIVVENELQDVMKDTTVQLGKQVKYSDHTETWSFYNNHLLIEFRNKTDDTIIKKHFQFILDGKLHIVYHDLVNDVTSTRIYERVI